MTKKHFEAFAEEIADNRKWLDTHEPNDTDNHWIQANYAANVIANVAIRFNPKFSKDKFLEACGL